MKKRRCMLIGMFLLFALSTTASVCTAHAPWYQNLSHLEEINPWFYVILSAIIGFLIGYFGMKVVILYSM